MNRSLLQLQRFTWESINPIKLSGQDIPADEFIKWKRFLTATCSAIKDYHIKNHCRRRIKSNTLFVLNQLVKISNTVSKYLVKESFIYSSHPRKEVIRICYLFTCTALEDLINELACYTPDAGGSILITDFSKPALMLDLKSGFAAIKLATAVPEIDHELNTVIINGIKQLISKKDLTRDNAIYIKVLLERIAGFEFKETGALVNFLLKNDFNLPEFFLYCIHYWQKQVDDQTGLHEQKEFLLQERQKIYLLSLEKGLFMSWRNSTLATDIFEFLTEQYVFKNQLLEARREAMADAEALKNGARFLINLPVAQFGLFIRMQIERGFLMKDHLGDLFTFFAAHFYTSNTTFISAESLQKKSTDVEFATAQKLKGHVIGMLNWLNAHYNLSNYN